MKQKKIFMILMCLILAFGLVACGGGGTGDEGDSGAVEVKGSKTVAFFENLSDGYTMVTEVDVEGMTGTMTTAVDGDKTYSESDLGGQKAIAFNDDEYYYTLMPAEKMYYKQSVESIQGMVDETSEAVLDDVDSLDESTMLTGTMDMDGKSYDYEEFSIAGMSERYLFDGKDLKYMLTMEGETAVSVIKIVSVEKGVDKALFKVPAGYQEFSMPY